jgi:hypothetical protein
MHREVNVTKHVKTSRGLRHCPVVLSANGSYGLSHMKIQST